MLLWSRRSFHLALAVACLTLVAVLASWRGESNETAKMESLWDADIFHLPPSVAFPGADWLGRIATPETVFVDPNDESRSYSSVYAYLLDDRPLDRPCRNFNAYVNSIFLPPQTAARIVESLGPDGAHYFMCYLRNFVGAVIVYYGVAAIFHYFCYIHPVSYLTFEVADRTRPTAETMWDQIKLAQSSMTLYVLLVLVDEFLVENGYTQVYYTVSEIGGWPYYFMYMGLYFSLVEIGIYWMHRTLHTNKWLYKNVHMLHHKYNKPETLTPWASIAFHPLDGILQACPYTICLFLVPCHYLTHFFLLFCTAVWATYIHDAMDWNVDPIMGSKYHTVHHTHYIYNYGQVFTFCDRFWGTFKVPEGPTGAPKPPKEGRSRPTSGRIGTKKLD